MPADQPSQSPVLGSLPAVQESAPSEEVPSLVQPPSGEYARLHEWLMLTTLGMSLAIALCVAFAYSWSVAANYGLGAIGGVIYLRMLGHGVAQLGKTRSRLGVSRFAVFVGLILLATQLESLQILPVFLGFITYKATLLIYLFQTLFRSSRSRPS
ncbi:MAG: hypothetical protein NW237_02205 [Cyanobacteriota bacterium]|nr:hypothetical protein [Cyanobacteriota bacterium]